jgi:hypothetical protein
MKTFREFLQEKAREDDHRERRRRRDEWVDAVDGLIRQLRDWLEQADSERLLSISRRDYDKLEQGLGAYEVPGLDVALGDSIVKISPVSRNVVGFVVSGGDAAVRPEGRVDISDGLRKYVLYRTITDGNQQWNVVDEHSRTTLLDQARFEEIMQDLLS